MRETCGRAVACREACRFPRLISAVSAATPTAHARRRATINFRGNGGGLTRRRGTELTSLLLLAGTHTTPLGHQPDRATRCVQTPLTAESAKLLCTGVDKLTTNTCSFALLAFGSSLLPPTRHRHHGVHHLLCRLPIIAYLPCSTLAPPSATPRRVHTPLSAAFLTQPPRPLC